MPLFILSFRHRDELTRLAESGGWQPIAGRRLLNAESRFVTSGAPVAVVDARGALDDGHKAVRSLADAAETNAAALLVLVSRTDVDALDRLCDEGATHFLASPFTEPQLLHALRFAARHAERMAAGQSAELSDGGARRAAFWRWQPGSNSVTLSPALARQAGLGGDGARVSLLELFRKLDPAGRKAARHAVDQVLTTGRTSAFAHGLDARAARMAHHIRFDPAEAMLVGRTEWLADEGEGRSPRDALTGVGDRRGLRRRLAHLLGQASAPGAPRVILILLALSRFDAINGAFGRGTGDMVLEAAARRIERVVGSAENVRQVARVAGAEFAIALGAPDDLAEGRRLAAALIESLARPIMAGGHVVALGCRAGVVASEEGDDPAALLRRASAALAEAKVADSGALRVVEGDSVGAAAFAGRLEIDLRRALDRDEIDIVYQPQVAIGSRRIVGVEALARWRHPEHGELGAATLFDVADRSDYLVQLSDHVQRKAIAEAAAWPPALGALRVSVNITAADIAQPRFADTFLQQVAASGFSPDRLTLEVTETGLIEDLGAAAILLARLREGRLRVAIDDFGTGYSSLAYLKSLPLDYLKIDKRLCEDITGSARDRVVVRSVIDMARSLGLDVIAEGVETEEQLELLAREGCNLYQGFLCAPPLDTASLLDLVAGHDARA